MSSGQKIIEALQNAVDGNLARVTIDGQVWVRQDAEPLTSRHVKDLALMAKMADVLAELRKAVLNGEVTNDLMNRVDAVLERGKGAAP